MAWDGQATTWATVATEERLDPFFWRVNLSAIKKLLPNSPHVRVLDVGAGEGRVAHAVAERGHGVVALDSSIAMLKAGNIDSEGSRRFIPAVADISALPIASESVGGVTCVMVLMSISDIHGALAEMARVLVAGGWACLVVLHPLATAGEIDDKGVLEVAAYGEIRELPPREVDRCGHVLRFSHFHRPVSTYLQATRAVGLQIDAVVEPLPDRDSLRDHPRLRRWSTTPNALIWRALKQ